MFKKTKGAKHSFVMSLLALLVCVTMFVGSTFAWFTDSVSSVNNIIKSGNLDVVVEYSYDGSTWTEMTDDASIFSDETLWEPGHTEAVALRVKNAGSLALKYDLSTTIYLEKEGTNVQNETFKLSDSLDVYSKGMTTNDVATYLATREDSIGSAMTKADFNQKLAEPTFLEEDEKLESGAEQYWVIAITMPTTVGNEANYLTGTEAPYIRFGIDVYASQVPHEEDTFGPDYDENAEDARFPYAAVQDNGKRTVVSEGLFGDKVLGTNNNPLALELDASYTFVAPEDGAVTEWIPADEFDEWCADYEVSVTGGDPSLNGTLPEGAIIMSGQYTFIDDAWQSFYTPEVPMDTPIMLLKTATAEMGYNGVQFTYEAIRDIVGTFQCGVKKNTDAASGVTMQVALVLYKEDAAGNIVEKKTVGKFNYTFE